MKLISLVANLEYKTDGFIITKYVYDVTETKKTYKIDKLEWFNMNDRFIKKESLMKESIYHYNSDITCTIKCLESDEDKAIQIIKDVMRTRASYQRVQAKDIAKKSISRTNNYFIKTYLMRK